MDHATIERIFSQAVDLRDVQERAAFLDTACGEDKLLRAAVERLLKHDVEGSFLESPENVAPTIDNGPATEQIGATIDRYKLVHEIGYGGMGVVYMAVQKEPVKRKVALKIIKPGMDTREVVARFQAERQALALMDHPNVAHVLDGGGTESGRPYFVMDLVEGTKITEYCDACRYTTRRRLKLFAQVCQAVHHAHQKGIIHRDLKPSNILVTTEGDTAVPKVIDFGIAKAIHQPLTDQSVYTTAAQMMGTPLYMSPEQAQRSGHDVDTRTDVYSLGVLLYELLAGATPFDKERLKESSLDDVKRIICEEEPPRPSRRLSTLAQADASIETLTDAHGTSLRTLTQELSGELDWIVMKALEKDRTRRYGSAMDFARDIERYLNDEPVEACPPSRTYRVGKFIRRHKTGLASTTVVLTAMIALLVAIAMISWSQRKLADQQREQTNRRLEVQQRINDILTDVVSLRGSSSPLTNDGEPQWTAAREKLQLAVGLATSAPVDPELLAQVEKLKQQLDQEQTTRDQYRRDQLLLGRLEQVWLLQANVDVSKSRFTNEDAMPLLRQALDDYGVTILENNPGEVAAFIASRPETLRQQLVAALEQLRAWYSPLIGMRLQSVEGTTAIVEIRPDSPAARDGRLQVGDELVGVGEGCDGMLVSTRSLARPAITELLRGESGTIVRLEVIPKDETEPRVYEIQRDPTRAWIQAVVQQADKDPWRCKLREAWALEDDKQRRAALLELAAHVDAQSQPVRMLTKLASGLLEYGASDRALTLSREIQRVNPGDLWANAGLAKALKAVRPPRFEEAARYYTAAIALRPDSAGLYLNLGHTLDPLGQLEEANAAYRESLRIAPFYALARCKLVSNLIDLGRDEEAEAVAREAVRLRPKSSAFHANLGSALRRLGKQEEAAAAYREAVRLDPDCVQLEMQTAKGLLRAGKREEAIEKLREVVQMDPGSAVAHYNLGVTLALAGREEEALDAYKASLKVDPGFVPALTNLTDILMRQGKTDEAVSVCREIIAEDPYETHVYSSLARCLFASGREKEACDAYRESIRLWPDHHNFLSYVNLSGYLLELQNPAVRNVEEAIRVAQKVVELVPKEEKAWDALGRAYLHHKEWQNAIAAFENSESFIDPRKYGRVYTFDCRSWGANYLCRAIAYSHLGQTEDAYAWFLVGERLMKQLGGASGGWLACLRDAADLLGMSANKPRNVPEIIAAYRRTLEIHPAGAPRNNDLAWLLATTADLSLREPARAVQYALEATKQIPWRAGYWNTLGVAYYRNGQWEEAIPALQKSLGLGSSAAAFDWLVLAMAHWQLEKFDEASEWFEKAAGWLQRRDPEMPNAEDFRRTLMEATQLLEETLASCRSKFGQEHPYTINTMSCLGQLYLYAGRLDDALPHLQQTLKLRQKYADSEDVDTRQAMLMLADVLMRRGEYSEAEPLLEQAANSQPIDVGIWYRLLLVQLAQGGEDAYRHSCHELLTRYLENDASPILGWEIAFLCRLGPIDSEDLQQALRLARKAYAEDSTNPRVRNELAAMLYRAGDYAESLKQLGISEDGPATDRSLDRWDAIWISLDYARLGQCDTAKKYYDRSVEASKNGPWRMMVTPIEYDLLRREAKTLLKRAVSTDGETNNSNVDESDREEEGKSAGDAKRSP